MVFDPIKSDREYLMRYGIQYRKYRDLESILSDFGTLLDFQYCDKTFLEEIDYLREGYEWFANKSKVLHNFRQSIQEDFWDFIRLDEINLSLFNMDKEYLFQRRLLHRKSWEKNDSLAEIVRNNLAVCINTYLNEWFTKKIEKLDI